MLSAHARYGNPKSLVCLLMRAQGANQIRAHMHDPSSEAST